MNKNYAADNAAWVAEQNDGCACTQDGAGVRPHRSVGVDETQGRFADVDLARCAVCGAVYLRYAVEYEGFSESGRWAMCMVKPGLEGVITPKVAAAVLDAAPWHIYGGSYWGHSGRRGTGALRWGIAG